MDDAVNFGGIGAVIGHELTHGFDDQGRKFDAQGQPGRLVDGGGRQGVREARRLHRRPVLGVSRWPGGVHLNGTLTLGENTADNGGVRIAYMALQDTLAGTKPAPLRDGFTPEQRLFLGWGQIWCQNETERERQAARADRSPLAGPLPRERRRLEHAGVPAGLRLPRGLADGARERLPGLVSGEPSRGRPPASRRFRDSRRPQIFSWTTKGKWYPQRDSNPCRRLERAVS